MVVCVRQLVTGGNVEDTILARASSPGSVCPSYLASPPFQPRTNQLGKRCEPVRLYACIGAVWSVKPCPVALELWPVGLCPLCALALVPRTTLTCTLSVVGVARSGFDIHSQEIATCTPNVRG